MVMSIENTHLRKGKGRYLYDVRIERRGGGYPKCDHSTDEVQDLDSERGGQIYPNLADVIQIWPEEGDAAILR